MSRPDDRAASEVIGAVIVFGFLVITFAIYQGIIIPQQNRSIEFDHNQAAHDAIQDLRNAIRQTATTGSEESVSITLGASYPQRVLGINPGISAGSIGTESLGEVTVRNITASDAETAEYFGDSTTRLGPFESKALVFRPVYSHYTQAPDTRYENTLAYNQFPNGANLSITDQAVIDGRKITLIALGGNVSEAQQGTVTIDTQSVSTARTAISVNDSGGPINITLPTKLSAADWEDLLEDELDPTGGLSERYVTAVKKTGPDQVSIILEEGVTYELRLAKVGVGQDAPTTGAKYIVDEEGDDTSVIENGTQKLVVQVRDRFNNPVSNVSVSASVTQPANASDPREGVTPGSATTDADGHAVFIYSAPGEVNGIQNADIDATFSGDGTVNESVTFDVRVLDADGSGSTTSDNDTDGVSEVNPSGEDSLILVDSIGTNSDTADLTFNNTRDTSVTVQKLRVPFYFVDSQDRATEVQSFAGVGSFGGSSSLPIGDPLTELDATVSFSTGESTVTIDFGTDDLNIQTRGDFFILVLELDTGTTATYFVAPQD